MKRLIPLAFFIACAANSLGQTVFFSLSTPPCHNDGVLTASMTGMTAPLTVTWNTAGTAGTNIVHTGVTGLFDALVGYSGGPVWVTAVDAAGISASNYYAGAPPFNFSITSTAAVCPSYGTDTAYATGGTPPYTYSWYNTVTSAFAGLGYTVSLPAGSYGVTITDAAGCVYGSLVDNFSGSGVIPYVAIFSDTIYTTPANCTDGSASLTGSLSGAVLPVSYRWSNGATTPAIHGLSYGIYDLTVVDAVGCVATASATVPQLTNPLVSLSATAGGCSNTSGAITAIVAGGTPPYSYVWSNGETTQTITGVGAGNYSVNITDANGCIGSRSGNVTSVAPISVTTSSAASLCSSNTGTATVHPSGGTGSYSITWYTFPPQTGSLATSLAPGYYHYKIKDAAGCANEGDVNVPAVDMISATFSSTSAICTLANGTMTVIPTGGVAPYHYLWNTGATSASISSVPAGHYSVKITDNLGCTINTEHDLYVNSTLGIGLNTTPATCIFNNDGNIVATPYGGITPYSFHWSGGGTGSALYSLPYGDYSLFVTDALGCTSGSGTHVGYDSTNSCYCTISGTIYNDANGNCLQDPGETGISKIQVKIGSLGYTYTDENGHYSYIVPAGTYVISETVPAHYPLTPCQVNGITVAAGASAGCEQTVDFANLADTVHDMHVTTWNYMHNDPLPGEVYNQVTLITNDGTVTEPFILGYYSPDTRLFPPKFTPANIYSGNATLLTTLGGFPSLDPGATKQFFTNYTMPANIPMGTSVMFKDTVSYGAPIQNWQMDATPGNNLNYFTTKVGSSNTPNFKDVYPRGTGPLGLISKSDSVLEYMVHFQHTGNYEVQNIIVIDTLDNNLDWSSLKPEFLSAPCKVTVEQSGAYKVAKFTFENIKLPGENNNVMGSNGMFTYTIKMKPGLAMGTQFRNRASIYFDEHNPVLTNVTLNTLGTGPAGTQPVAAETSSSFLVFPNPAASTFNAVINSSTAEDAGMNITDVAGKIIMTKTINLQMGPQTISVDASQLVSGIYFVSLNANGTTQTQKLVIIK